MTTAHKPTYHAAVASAHAGGFRFHAQRIQRHARDQSAHTTLKYRQAGQSAPADLQARDLRQQLIDRENAHKQRVREEKRRLYGASADDDDQHEQQADDDDQQQTLKKHKQHQLLLTHHATATPSTQSSRQADGDEHQQQDEGEEGAAAAGESSDGMVAPKIDLNAVDLSSFDDADEVLSQSDDEQQDDDEDDDEAELQRELEKIRADRAAEKQKQEAAEAAQRAASSNPLLASSSAFFSSLSSSSSSSSASAASSAPLTRRWDEDVVFKNQSRGDVSVRIEKRFINDTIRSDFHRNFINKYIR